ncbi:MAG: LptA/OstA family protein [bacterium]
MKRFCLIIFSLFITIGIFCCGYSQTISSSTTVPTLLQINQPYEIYGDKLLSATINKTRITKLIGHAKLILKTDKITITANELWFYSEEKKLNAFKNVMIIKDDPVNGRITATADTAEYYEADKKAKLTGGAKIVRDKDVLQGDIIKIEFTSSGPNIEIEGNVNGMVYPKPESNKPEE